MRFDHREGGQTFLTRTTKMASSSGSICPSILSLSLSLSLPPSLSFSLSFSLSLFLGPDSGSVCSSRRCRSDVKRARNGCKMGANGCKTGAVQYGCKNGCKTDAKLSLSLYLSLSLSLSLMQNSLSLPGLVPEVVEAVPQRHNGRPAQLRPAMRRFDQRSKV